MRKLIRRCNSIAAVLGLAACVVAAQETQSAKRRLPTGAWLDAAGRSFDVGNMPLAMRLSPDGRYLVLSLSGWREQGVEVVERETGRVVQTLSQPAAFLGLAFSPDGRTLYVAGGNEDAVFRYGWRDGRATLVDKLVLAEKKPKEDGTRFPAGLAVSRDGRFLYVAENMADSLAVIDLTTKRVVARHKTDHYPYEVAVAPDNKVYVSAWGGATVSVFSAGRGGALAGEGKIVVGRHPSALALNADGSRLFVASASTDRVAVVDTRGLRVIAQLADSPPSGAREGSTPDALALSADGARLFVAEADNNAVAVFDLGRRSAGTDTGRARDALAGRIPVGWYPTAVMASANELLVLNGKGRGTRANAGMRQPDGRLEPGSTDYTLGQLNGTITMLEARPSMTELREYTRRVNDANNWDHPPRPTKYPPFKHVIYVIKENRTYDQMFGDVKEGDGDPSLLFFTRDANPNHRALAARFGLFDRFFVNAEVSQQGHPWSTSAYVTDYTEKTTPTLYSSRRASPDDEGEVDEPLSGFLWDAAIRKKLTLRNYGEYCVPVDAGKRYRATKAALAPYTNPDYPSFDMSITDQRRVEVWLKEFREYVSKGDLPALQIMHLPGDHTSGGRAGRRTPRAYVADNDLALGRMVEALSRTKFWRDTVLFVLEDDAQDGPDHVDSHRSVLLVISAYNRGGTNHRFVNTTDVVATIEAILGLTPLSQFDRFGRPLDEIFVSEPDLSPYVAQTPAQPLDEMNPSQGSLARDSERLDLSKEDVADMSLFNHILWRAIKGEGVPYPRPARATPLDYMRAQ
ncbi:MAG TPA: bifunctional YncE family protein/alkaline phosphatase family protein [Pyrinomonadaceae bacterium]|nr:bifunctional YncE family protein/alkaline phosphatase family protein [Pyrinomonadaceae bacterium]